MFHKKPAPKHHVEAAKPEPVKDPEPVEVPVVVVPEEPKREAHTWQQGPVRVSLSDGHKSIQLCADEQHSIALTVTQASDLSALLRQALKAVEL